MIKLLDDTSSSSIRRGIFILSSFTFLVESYNLSIPIEVLVKGAESGSNLRIETDSLLIAFCFLIGFLLIRLWQNFTVDKYLIVNELHEKQFNDLSNAKETLEILEVQKKFWLEEGPKFEAVEEALSGSYSLLKSEKDEFQKISGETQAAIREEIKELSALFKDVNGFLPVNAATRGAEPNVEQPSVQDLKRFIERRGPMLESEATDVLVKNLARLNEILNGIRSEGSEFERTISRLKIESEKLVNFQSSSAVDQLEEIIKNHNGDKSRALAKRNLNFKVFDIGVPAVVGGVSILWILRHFSGSG